MTGCDRLGSVRPAGAPERPPGGEERGHPRQVKRRRAASSRALAGKTVALVFQKPSMRTRVAFEVAVAQLGGSIIYMGQDDIQLGTREPMKDVARVLSGYVDAIVLRTFAHPDVEEFAGYAACPQCGYVFPPPQRQKHDATASSEGILSDQPTRAEHEVADV